MALTEQIQREYVTQKTSSIITNNNWLQIFPHSVTMLPKKKNERFHWDLLTVSYIPNDVKSHTHFTIQRVCHTFIDKRRKLQIARPDHSHIFITFIKKFVIPVNFFRRQ